jgi:hypothetical protein
VERCNRHTKAKENLVEFLSGNMAAKYAGEVVVLAPELWSRLEAEARSSGRSAAAELTLAVQIHCGLVDPAVRFPELDPERMRQAARHADEGKLVPLPRSPAGRG